MIRAVPFLVRLSSVVGVVTFVASAASAQVTDTYSPPAQLRGDTGDDPDRDKLMPLHDGFSPDDVFGNPADPFHTVNRIRGLANVYVSVGGAHSAQAIFDRYVRAANETYAVSVEPFCTQTPCAEPGLDPNMVYSSAICAVTIAPPEATATPPFRYVLFYTVDRATTLSWVNYVYQKDPGDPNSPQSVRLVFLNRLGQGGSPALSYGQGKVPEPPAYVSASAEFNTICNTITKTTVFPAKGLPTAPRPLPQPSGIIVFESEGGGGQL